MMKVAGVESGRCQKRPMKRMFFLNQRNNERSLSSRESRLSPNSLMKLLPVRFVRNYSFRLLANICILDQRKV